MNIVLADVQSLNVNVSEPVSEAVPGEGNFTDLMERHLNQDTELTTQVEFPQVVDIKEYLSSTAILSDAGEFEPVDSETSDIWYDNLANQHLSLTGQEPAESVAVNIGKSEISITSENTVEIDQISIYPTNAVVGELLPVNGKALPPVQMQLNNQTQNVLPVQGDLSRQLKGSPGSSIERGNLDLNTSEVAKLADTRPVESMNPRMFDATGLNKTDIPVESFNFSKAVEFQVANNGVAEFTESSSNSIRTLTPFNASLSTQPSSLTLPPQLETLTVPNPRDTGAWGNGLGERISWMVNQKLNTATIRMDPPMLGRLDVQIQISDEGTNVTIHTQHAQTRDMIDNASFRLREFLQENGYQNVNVDVSHQQQQEQQTSEQSVDDTRSAGEDRLHSQDADNGNQTPGNQYFSSDSVVDYFA